MGVKLACKVCGKEFQVPPSRATKAAYCSAACFAKSAKQRTAHMRKRVTLTCASCGKEFESVACHAHRRKYCSRKCKHQDRDYRAAISDRYRGSSNPSWKGGRTRQTEGYIYVLVPEHPFASNGYVLEHRLVMERWLRASDPESPFLLTFGNQRYLIPDCHVHHK